MKTLFSTLLTLSIILLLGSCVSKRNYLDLEAKLKKCNEDLSYTTTEKMDFENNNKELERQISSLELSVARLKNDTLSLTKKLNESERQLVKSKIDYDELLRNFTGANAANNEQVNSLLANLDSIKVQLEAKEQELNEKEARLLELQNILSQKDEEVKALKNKVALALQGFVDKGLNVHEKNGKVYVSMEEKLLFASGSWRIGSGGLEAIEELGKVLAIDTTINVMIEGHTDDVPYKGSGDAKDNWDLSVLRATSVLKALIKNQAINPQRVTAAGRGEFVPIASNETKEDRAKNRRTEIILTPKLDELFNIIENN